MFHFEFDSKKSLENLKHHGVDFHDTQKLWFSPHVMIPAKNVSGENRSALLGTWKGKIWMVIYTERGSRIRIISCHRVDKKWERIYYDLIKKTQIN